MSWSAVQNAILARWAAACPVAAGLRAYDSFNATFRPPAIVPSTPTTSVWMRLTINPFQGTSTPFGLAENANNYHEGQIVQQIFYPRNVGEGFLDSIVNAAVLVFHRRALGTVQCKDSQPPMRIPPDDGDAAFAQINVVTPYLVIEVL